MQNLAPGCIEECPACPHRSFSMNESLLRKQEWLNNRLGNFFDVIGPIQSVADDQRWHYRNKVCLATSHSGQSWNIGVRKRDKLIAIPKCPVHSKLVNINIQYLSRIIPPSDHFPFAFFMQSGAQVTLGVKSKSLPPMEWFDEQVMTALQHNGVEALWIHLHPSTGKKVIGKGGWHLIFGKTRSISEYGMVYGPSSFSQVLPLLHVQSLQVALDFLAPTKNTFVLDLYCGTGSTLQRWLAAGSGCVGVELSGEAIQCASLNAPKAILLRGACSHRIPQLSALAATARGENKEILLYVNPPRTGLAEEVSDWIVQVVRPNRMAYLSCSAGTLQRDLAFLQKHGFQIRSIIPYDFFPHTLHFEILALIEREP
ncbi:MAG: hypothetical protein U1C46_04490 [Bacteroidales bacterium]|nr:hypothetical protein [Bacteroidales bacterium]MDZ4204060.1 hypothetical protein [Bacteroidales bacterium]